MYHKRATYLLTFQKCSPHRCPQFHQTFLVNVYFTIKETKHNNEMYMDSNSFVWEIERGNEKFNTKTMKRNFTIFRTERMPLFRKDSAKYFSQN